MLVAPTVNVSLSWYHMQFPGSIRLSTTTFFQVFREICDSLVHHGFERSSPSTATAATPPR